MEIRRKRSNRKWSELNVVQIMQFHCFQMISYPYIYLFICFVTIPNHKSQVILIELLFCASFKSVFFFFFLCFLWYCLWNNNIVTSLSFHCREKSNVYIVIGHNELTLTSHFDILCVKIKMYFCAFNSDSGYYFSLSLPHLFFLSLWSAKLST